MNERTERWEKPEKYSTRWAEEKRKTCKNCLKRESWGFCLRHCPRMVITRTVSYNQEQVDKLLASQHAQAVRETVEKAVEIVKEDQNNCHEMDKERILSALASLTSLEK